MEENPTARLSEREDRMVTETWLPDELLSQIFETLPARDWMTCSRVCRQWRAEALSIDMLQSRGWRDYAQLRQTPHMICQACMNKRGYIRPTTKLRECSSCRDKPERALITKTRAMREYGFRAIDLIGIPRVCLPNPYNNNTDMQLFRVYDLPFYKIRSRPRSTFATL